VVRIKFLKSCGEATGQHGCMSIGQSVEHKGGQIEEAGRFGQQIGQPGGRRGEFRHFPPRRVTDIETEAHNEGFPCDLLDQDPCEFFFTGHQVVGPAQAGLGNLQTVEHPQQMVSRHEGKSRPSGRLLPGGKNRRNPQPAFIGNKGASEAPSTRSLAPGAHRVPGRKLTGAVVGGRKRLMGEKPPTGPAGVGESALGIHEWHILRARSAVITVFRGETVA